MPTVDWIDGLRIVVYPNDHRPAHVHVIGNGHEAVFNLHCPEGPPELRENFGFSRTEIAAVRRTLKQRLAQMCAAWSEHHGYY